MEKKLGEDYHFKDCPINRNYNICTCEMSGEEIAIIEWQISRQEGNEKWWQFIAKLTLKFFGCGNVIVRVDKAEK